MAKNKIDRGKQNDQEIQIQKPSSDGNDGSEKLHMLSFITPRKGLDMNTAHCKCTDGK